MAIIDKIKLSGQTFEIQDSNASKTVELTQAEYDALVTKDPNTYYIITDATPIDITNYYTKTQTDDLLDDKLDVTAYTPTDLSNYYTKSETSGATQIQTALNGKADSSTVNSLNNVVTAHTANTTVHVTAQDKTNWNNKSDFSGNYNDLTNKPTIPTVPTSNTAFTNDAGYITIDAISGKVDTSTYNTYTAATDTAIAGKQDTLVSSTNIKTINNESILGSGNIDIQGGSTYTAGRGISIANDTISLSLPISAGTVSNSIAEGDNTTASGIYGSHAEGYHTRATGWGAHAEGNNTQANGNYSHAEGDQTAASGNYSHAEGFGTRANNLVEHASGQYNVSSKANNTFGDSGNTLFSVGNGTSSSARHNAFEIRQNGDIYLTKDGQDVKLQDQLGGGGGGGTVESAITSGSTNAVESKAIWSATTFNKNILLTFDGNRRSTNYPKGCGKLVVGNIESNSNGNIYFKNDEGLQLGLIFITNYGNISVNTGFEGATYEIDGNNVTIIYPSTDITLVEVSFGNYTYTAVVEGAWVNENTYMKSEVDAIANSKLDASAYTPTVVDSALYVASQNPVQNQVLYPELRIDGEGETETTLTFENNESTNYPNGCTKLNVEVPGSNNNNIIYFKNHEGSDLGIIVINNWGNISVSNSFGGASYEISGTTVIITYPTVISVTKIRVTNSDYVIKAIAALATPLKDQVVANTTALGGLSLVKLTQAEYDALATKDNNTLYVIVN